MSTLCCNGIENALDIKNYNELKKIIQSYELYIEIYKQFKM